MKISVAQMRAVAGNIPENIKKHERLIDIVNSMQSDAIFFPELSLTGYEPRLAKELATNPDDSRLGLFQKLTGSEPGRT